jgi:alkyl hydroperoxide reductase subunit F
VRQAEERANITIRRNVATRQIVADSGRVNAIEYQERESGEVHTQSLDGVFVQIGLVPNSGFLKGVVELSQYGEVIIDERGRTSEPGIFACGDVTTVPYKQIVIAMGEGAKASLAAFDHLLLNTGSDQQAA